MNEALLPEGWPRPKGYANGVAATGRQVYVAGQVGWNPQGVWETDDFAAQTRQALANIVAVLQSAGRRAEAHRAHDLVRDRASARTSLPAARSARRFARSSASTTSP
jgi:enamine deaminase RidA (YjgF/YER057c/UK114 family)